MPPIKNVLIYPCGGEVGLELNRCLRDRPHICVHGCSSSPEYGSLLFENHVGYVPGLENSEFLPTLTSIIRAHEINYIFPGDDEAIAGLSELASDGLLEAEVMAPDSGVCRLCGSQSAIIAFFSGKLPVPKMFDPGNVGDADFPVLVEPDAGRVSGNVFLARDRREMQDRLRSAPMDIVVEHLPGKEFAVDCFTDGAGALLFVSGREKIKTSGYIGIHCRLTEDPAFRTFAEAINCELKLRGPWFFILKGDQNGKLRLTEIYPRLGSSAGLQRAMGLNLPLLALYDRMGLPLRLMPNRLPGAEIVRPLANHYRLGLRYDAVYMGLEDTLIQGGKVNTEAMRFVFQCLNKKIPVTIVSRCSEDPREILRRYRMEGIFDNVIRVRGSDGKSSAIISKKSIFIDQSFTERQEVH